MLGSRIARGPGLVDRTEGDAARMRPAPLQPVRDELTRAIESLDLDAFRDAYRRQGEFARIERFLPASLVDRFVREFEQVRAKVHRSHVPRRKKSGSVSYFTLRAEALAIATLYHAPAMREFLSAVVGRPLMLCPERDPHSCALYVYTEPGDHIAAHYDTSFYRGARYTVLLGLINRTTSRLVGQLFRTERSRRPVDFELSTDPGTLVIFNGDKFWHAVTGARRCSRPARGMGRRGARARAGTRRDARAADRRRGRGRGAR